jgi:hypothetical protein
VSDLVFLDTECLGLDPEAPVWEFAAMRRSPSGAHVRLECFIAHKPGRWLDSLPEKFRQDYENRFDPDVAYSGYEASRVIAEVTRDAIVIGCNPSFDTERLAKLLRRNGVEPAWHYHLYDIASMALAHLSANGAPIDQPWKSDHLSAAVGVDPGEFARHTAMGDVLWTMAQYDAVMGGAA